MPVHESGNMPRSVAQQMHFSQPHCTSMRVYPSAVHGCSSRLPGTMKSACTLLFQPPDGFLQSIMRVRQ